MPGTTNHSRRTGWFYQEGPMPMYTSARYPLTGHILYVKTIAGTMVATIKVGESRILVVLDTENPEPRLLPEKK